MMTGDTGPRTTQGKHGAVLGDRLVAVDGPR